MAGPKAVVTAPPAVARPYGLLQTADVLEGAAATRATLQGRWENGYQISPEGCGTGFTWDPCKDGQTKTPETHETILEVTPFGIGTVDECSAIGWQSRDYEARARRLLEACGSKQVEAELWTGTLAKASNPAWENQYLAREDTSDVVATSATPEQALACLEQALGQCSCGPGMIHATPQVVTMWGRLDLVEDDGDGHLVTILGTRVVAGAGYDGSSPNGVPAADGSIWAYATGWVTVRLGEIVIIPGDMEQALNRSTNKVTYYAERLAAYDFGPCCHAAAEIDLDVCMIGGLGS